MPFMPFHAYYQRKPDAEPNVRLRRIRFRLGYGPSWTFRQALWNIVEPYVGFAMVSVTILIILWIFSRC